MDWWESFDATIRSKIREDARLLRLWQQHEQNRTLDQLAQRGQVASDASVDVALFEAMLYQRGHIDAFKKVTEPLHTLRLRPRPRRIKIMDIGCGAGTVLFAFDEMLGARAEIDYVGFDHHEPTRELFVEMMAATKMRPNWTATVKPTLTATVNVASRWGEADLVFVTCSYALCQDSMTDRMVRRIVDAVAQLVEQHDKVRVVIADATRPGKVGQLCELLDDMFHVESSWPAETKMMPYTLRFPALDGRTYRQTLPGREVEGRYLRVSQNL
jgi:SAM-dependent methyltransferase